MLAAVTTLLLVALHLAAGLVVAARLLPAQDARRDRALAGLTLGSALPIVEVLALSQAHALRLRWLAALVASVVPAVACASMGAEARTRALSDARAALATLTAGAKRPSLAPALAVGGVSLLLAIAAAAWLEIWAWDALGYHLPIVWDALAEGTFRRIPTHIPYLNVYPRGGERLFAWARLLLRDDRLMDLAQLPAAIAAAAATALLALRAGAKPVPALAAGAVWLAVPAVALQIPTNYVDVLFAFWLLAAACFVTGPLDKPRAALAGVALALVLACKAVSLVPVAVCGLVLVARTLRARRPGLAAVAVAIALLGTPTYLANLAAHGNPVWPVEVKVGPLVFPGVDPGGPMYVRGLPSTLAALPGPVRFLASLAAEPRHYIYDMRFGGYGPAVQALLVALPLVAFVFWRRRDSWSSARAGLAGIAVTVAATAALPVAHWPRFALAVPAALLALGAAAVSRLGARAQSIALVLWPVLAAVGLVRALPGYTGGDGPLLPTLAFASPDARLRAATVDGRPTLWHDVKARLVPGEAIAYDRGFELPGLLWRSDGATEVVYLDHRAPPADGWPAWLARHRVRVVLLGDDAPARALVELLGPRAQRIARCPLDPCTIYAIGAAR